MFKFLSLLFLWIKLITLSSATWQITDSTDDPISCYTNGDDEYYDGLQKIFNANNDVASKWLYDLARTKGQENLFTSLYSLLLFFGQLAAYADEPIRTELLNVIYLQNIDEVGRVLRGVADRLNHKGKYNSTMLSLMTADQKYKFTDDFRRTYNATIYGKTANLNFKDSYTTANYLNDWMRQDTCHQDHDFVSSEQISSDLGVIITSFIHLTLNWENSFRPLKRVPIDFLENNNVVTLTDAWYFDGYTKYSDDEELNAKLIDILMLGDWRLSIVYPNNQVELFDIIRKLQNINTFKSAFANTELTRLRLTVPLKEDVCGFEDYVDIMKFADLLTEIFDSNFNGFRRAFENGIGCNISHMFHKLHLNFANGLNAENAAESSAAKYSDSDVININVNKPFLFYIICPNDTQVFAGAVNKAN